MADTDIFSDQEILAKTLYGEARGEGYEGQVAVANVVMNRVKLNGWRGHDVRSVCLKPFQFSCWNQSDPNRSVIMEVTQDDAIYLQCLGIADLAISGALADNTNGATSYYAASLTPPPAWATDKTPCAVIGNQLFFQV